MTTQTAYPSRRKPGADENPRLPFRQSKSDTPLAHRRELLRTLRADPDLPSSSYRVLETQLDRIPCFETNLVTWDGNQKAAKRAGLCQRTLEFAYSDLIERGMILRFTPVQFRSWLEAIDDSLGFSYPEAATGSPRRFTVMLVRLSPEDAQKVREIARDILSASPPKRKNCGQETPSDPARIALTDRKICADNTPDLALTPPIVEFESSEFESENRRRDGSLDPGEKIRGEKTQAELDAEDRSGWEALAAGDDPIVARLARSTLKGIDARSLTSRPSPAPEAEVITPETPKSMPDAAAQIAAMKAGLATAAAVLHDSGSEAIDPNSRIWELVLGLPDASPARVDAVVRALMTRFRDWNEATKLTYLLYLGLVSRREFSAELVAGLVKDACSRGVRKPGHHLSRALKDEFERQKNRSPGALAKSPDDRL
jgi:hypothetical protein